MRSLILTAAAALTLTTAAASAAEPGSWSTRWTDPHGGTYEGGGKCTNGTCQSSGTFTGPYGGVWHHSGNAHQVAPGRWSGEGHDRPGRRYVAALPDLASRRNLMEARKSRPRAGKRGGGCHLIAR